MASQSRPGIVLVMLLLNAFSTPLMLSSTNVALPGIAEGLSLSALTLSWVPMAFLMASAMFVLVFGKLSDGLGRKRVFLTGVVCVIASSLFAAFAVTGEMLLVARFLQGTSGAMINATQIAIISSVVSPKERGKYIGMITAAVYVGLSAGPLLGGIVIDQIGWRAAFVMHVPLAVVVLLIGLFAVKDEWRNDNPTRFDRLGALLWTSSIAIFCIGVSLLPSATALSLVAVSWVILYLFLQHARRSEQPLWDVKLFFQNRVFTLSATASLLMYAATYANVVLLSLYLQSIKALTASQAGMIMMVQPAMMAIFSPIMGKLSDRIEPRMLASTGMAITATGLFILARLHTDSAITQVIIALLLTGGGFSLFSSPNINAIMGSVTPTYYGSASGAVATTRIIGQLSSMVLVTLSISLVMGDVAVSPETRGLLANAIDLSFTIAGCLCLLGILFSVSRGRLHTTSEQ